MTYATHHCEFATCVGRAAASRGAVANKAGVLRRVVDAIVQSHQRQADWEIARCIARSGGRPTDDIERRLMQHLQTSSWSVRD